MKNILVVIDMQNDFISGPLGSAEAVEARNKIAKKLSDVDPDTYVIFTQDTHYDNYLETQEGKNLPVVHCIEGTEGWKIDKNLTQPFNDAPAVVQKETFGSFGLISLINSFREEDEPEEELNISLCGVCTDICVVSNALILKATYPEAKISVYKNLCAGVTPETHEAALTTMKSCQINII